jgi:hypothetical protein
MMNTNPRMGKRGNFLILKGVMKGGRKPGCFNRRFIRDRLTKANTTSILNTEIPATSVSLPEYRTIVATVKAETNIVDNHGVFREE